MKRSASDADIALTWPATPLWSKPITAVSRAIRQDGDTTERIQEAIDTCPVDCIHWVPFEDLEALRAELATQTLQPLGMPRPTGHRRLKPRARG